MVDDPGLFNVAWPAGQVYHCSDLGSGESVCVENNANYCQQQVFPIPTATKPNF
jgi:hypothetical protein